MNTVPMLVKEYSRLKADKYVKALMFTMVLSTVIVGCSRNPGKTGKEHEKDVPFVFIHVSDPHVGASVAAKKTFEKTEITPELTRTRLQQVVAQVNSLTDKPRFVIITGDLTHNGKDDQYAAFKEIVSHFEIPCYVTTGNHDYLFTPDRYKRHFDSPNYSFDIGGFHFIAIDSRASDNRPGGHIRPEVMNWLKNDLSKVGVTTPVILFLHQPLVLPSEISHKEWKYVPDNADDLAKLIQPYNVRGVFSGHVHYHVNIKNPSRRDGKPFADYQFVARSTAYSFFKPAKPGYYVVSVSKDKILYDFHLITAKRVEDKKKIKQ